MVAASGGNGVSARSPVAEEWCLGAVTKGRDKGKKRLIHVMSILAPLAVRVAVVGAVGVCAQKLVEVDSKLGLVLKEDTMESKKDAVVAGGNVQHHHHSANGLNGANVQSLVELERCISRAGEALGEVTTLKWNVKIKCPYY